MGPLVAHPSGGPEVLPIADWASPVRTRSTADKRHKLAVKLAMRFMERIIRPTGSPGNCKEGWGRPRPHSGSEFRRRDVAAPLLRVLHGGVHLMVERFDLNECQGFRCGRPDGRVLVLVG